MRRVGGAGGLGGVQRVGGKAVVEDEGVGRVGGEERIRGDGERKELWWLGGVRGVRRVGGIGEAGGIG